MAVANTKSTIVTNADATPVTPTDVRLSHGRVRAQLATVEVAAADDDNSVYRLFRVHSSWAPVSIRIANDAITSGSVYDLGIWKTAKDGGAVVVQEAFGSDIDLSSAHALTEYLNEALNIDKVEKKFWELAGLSADPDAWYDIALIGTTVGSAAGTISGQLLYVAGD